jgi:signal transduction histidine kinase/ligand-binding sensor domain-containing protein
VQNLDSYLYFLRRIVIIFQIFTTIPSYLFSQDIIDYSKIYTVQQWKTDNGLPQNSVNAIYQTQDGYLWLATYGGLVRFDGVKFTTFSSDNTPEIKNSRAIGFIPLPGNDFITKCENNCFILKTKNAFYFFNNPDDLLNHFYNEKYGNQQPQQDSVFVLTDKNLLFLKNANYKIGSLNLKLSEIIKKYSYFEGTDNSLWVNLNGKEIVHIYKNKIKVYTNSSKGDIIFKLFQDSKGVVWMAGSGASFCQIKDNKFFSVNKKYGFSNTFIYEIKEYDGVILIGNDTHGLLIIKDNEYCYWNKSNGLPDNHIKSIFRDREGNLWLGANTGGLLHLKKRKVNIILNNDKKASNIIQSLQFDSKNNLIIGTNGTGLCRRIGEGYSTIPEFNKTERFIWSVFKDSKNQLWVGTASSGVFVLNGKDIKNYSSSNSLVGDRIRVVFEDSKKNIWVGTEDRGATKFEGNRQTNYNSGNGLSNDFIISIYEDNDKNIWFGTNGSGVTKLSNNKFTGFTTKDGLPNDIIRAIYQDKEGAVWFGTYGGGLARLKDGKFKTIKTENGLFDNIIHFIIEDEKERFWMASNRGFFMASRKDLNDFLDGKSQSVYCVSFGKAEGMLSEECNGGFQPNAIMNKNGKLYVPTIEGVAVIDYLNLKVNKIPPAIVIESVVTDNINETTGDTINIKPGTKQIEIKFTGLSFTDPKKMQFKAILSGFDEKWSFLGNRREVYYTNLPPGEYIFKVIGCNNDGLWNLEGASITIVVEPFFYQTIFFKILLSLLALITVMAIILWRSKTGILREKRLQQIIAEKTSQLTEEIKERKSAEEELLKIRKIDSLSVFIGGISHDFNNLLTAIIGNLAIAKIKAERKEFDKINDIIDRIETASLRAKDLTQQLRIFSSSANIIKVTTSLSEVCKKCCDLFGWEKSIHFNMNMSEDLHKVDIDSDQILRAIQSIITNSIEAMPEGGEITLATDNEFLDREKARTLSLKPGNYVKLSISDDGIGITSDNISKIFDPYFTTKPRTSQKGSGLGLAIVYMIIKQHNGYITVESTPGEGTTFTVYLPSSLKKTT